MLIEYENKQIGVKQMATKTVKKGTKKPKPKPGK
jgi:hypothetical protein